MLDLSFHLVTISYEKKELLENLNFLTLFEFAIYKFVVSIEGFRYGSTVLFTFICRHFLNLMPCVFVFFSLGRKKETGVSHRFCRSLEWETYGTGEVRQSNMTQVVLLEMLMKER